MGAMRGRRLTVLAAICVLSVARWLAGPAGAGAVVRQFGSLGSASGQFVEPQGIAVDQRSGDVFIVDSNNHRVERFSGDGAFLYAWGWGVLDGRTMALQRCTTRCHAGLRGEGAGQLGFAEGVAVDNDPASPSYGDVYVSDIGNLRVEKFSPFGEFLVMFGGGVNATARERGEAAREDVCPANPDDRCRAGRKGAASGEFSFRSEGDFVAVGPEGTVYIGDTNRVQEFDPSGAYERQVRFPPPGEAEGAEAGGIPALAVNSVGDLYVVRNGVGGVNEYSPSGQLLLTLDYQELETMEGPTPTLALDAAGDIFIDEHIGSWHRIVEYDAAGIELASFDVGMEDGLHGLAFGNGRGRLYVVHTNNNVAPPIARVRVVEPPPAEPLAVCGCRGSRGF